MIAFELFNRLKKYPWIDPWISEEKIFGGQDFNLEIQKTIVKSDVALILLSHNSITKEGYIQKELKKIVDFAFEKPEGTIFMIPIRLENCEIPFSLRNFHYIDYFPEDFRKESFKKLITSLQKRSEQLLLKENKTIQNVENEIKLTINVKTQAKMLASIREKGINDSKEVIDIIKAVFDLAEFDIVQEKMENIIDKYFDTKDLFLFKNSYSLRIRNVQDNYEITVKKPIDIKNGLFKRREFSTPIQITDNSEEFGAIVNRIASASFDSFNNAYLTHNLTVDNERRSFTLKRRNEDYSLSLDLFRFLDPQNRVVSEIISEIEIEALNQPAKNRLPNIQSDLLKIIGYFEYSTDSKYMRGLKILNQIGNGLRK